MKNILQIGTATGNNTTMKIKETKKIYKDAHSVLALVRNFPLKANFEWITMK